MKDSVNAGKTTHRWIVLIVSFLVICGTPRGSSRLGRYGFVKLEAPKNGQEAPSWLQVFNERVKWL
jgi:hypothetical protein